MRMVFTFISDFIRRKIVRNQRARWNHQYARGQWEGLKDDVELERQEVVKEFFIKYKGTGNLLEFGCGYGVLPDVIFKKKHYSHYLGIDVSDFIINHIQKLSDSKHRFEVGDIDSFDYKEKYDVVLYNEVINYSKDISLMLNNAYKNGMKAGGIFIISVHEFKRSHQIWENIHKTLDVLESRTIVNSRSRWQVEVLKMK